MVPIVSLRTFFDGPLPPVEHDADLRFFYPLELLEPVEEARARVIEQPGSIFSSRSGNLYMRLNPSIRSIMKHFYSCFTKRSIRSIDSLMLSIEVA